MAKLRNAMNHVKNLVPLSKNVITNKNTLTNLNSSEIYEKYITNCNFKSYLIITEMLNYLNEMNSDENNLILPQINAIKDDTKSTFENNINKGLLFGKITQIAKSIFVPYNNFDLESKSYLYNSSKNLLNIS